MLSRLSGEGAEFVVVGAYAMAAHGVPRATGDIDIWVRPSPQNADCVLRALRRGAGAARRARAAATPPARAPSPRRWSGPVPRRVARAVDGRDRPRRHGGLPRERGR